jgi:protein-S-isoprenylcysteine O-methyltransferase Ste14
MTPHQQHHPTTNGNSSNGYEMMLNGSKSYEIVDETNNNGSSALKDMTTTTTTTVKRLTYRINGHLAFWVTLLLLNVSWPTWKNVVTTSTTSTTTTTPSSSASAVVLTFGKAPLIWLYDHYTLLAFVTIIYALGLSTYLYIKSYSYEINSTTGKKVPVLLAAGGNSGNVIYDYFMGRELNPRSIKGTFDWKEFCELRPGLIGWCILNMAMLTKQYDNLGYVTGSMILINIFQGLYVWDALYQERAILTTMDITTDGFGYMLIFGDLVWVPYTYSLQSRYLVDHDPYLSWYTLLCIVLVNIFGYLIFRGANGQKDAFRRNPESMEVSHLTYLQTKRGTKLLTSGWWGLARKINYTGDWIMGLSWCMVCGFDSIVPYYYAIYFAILLVHRSVRDDHMCQEKYGDDWDRYKEFVPYRFIPGII